MSARYCIALSALFTLSACAIKSAPATTVSPRPLAQGVAVYRPEATDGARPDGPVFQSPAGVMSLGDAVALALLHNPDLAAFAWETRAREARVLQAGTPPNPVLGVLAEDIGASAVASGASAQAVQPQTTIQLSQLVELGGKRAARQTLATLDRDIASWDYETARIDVLTQVTQAFTDVLAAQNMAALMDETLRVVDQTQQAVIARVSAGVVSPIEQTRAEVVLAGARIEADRTRRDLDAARRRLASTWGATDATYASVIGDMDQLPPVPSLVDLAGSIGNSPVLARWASEVSRRQAALDLERARRVPDITVSAGYRRFTDIDSNAFIIGGSIPLPFFDRNRGGIEEANNRLSKAFEERRAAQARVLAALADAYRNLASAHEEVTALRATVLPGSQQAFEAISEGYRVGRFGYVDVLDAQRTLIAARAQYLRALSNFHKAAADVERLIGAPLDPAANPPSTN